MLLPRDWSSRAEPFGLATRLSGPRAFVWLVEMPCLFELALGPNPFDDRGCKHRGSRHEYNRERDEQFNARACSVGTAQDLIPWRFYQDDGRRDQKPRTKDGECCRNGALTFGGCESSHNRQSF